MTDTHGDQSPWERDDWMPVESAPATFPAHDAGHRRLGADPTGVGENEIGARRAVRGARGIRLAPTASRSGRHGIVGVLVTLAVVGAIGFVVSQRGTGSAERTGSGPNTPSTSDLPGVESPSTSSAISSPDVVPTTAPLVLLHPVPGADPNVEVVPATADGTLPDLAEVGVGEAPPWTEWSIRVPPGLDSLSQPTEVVVLSPGLLHRIEFPSGRVRSVALAKLWDPSAQLAVAGDTIAVTTFRDVLLVGEQTAVASTDLGQGVDWLRARPAQGDFVVTLRRSNPQGPDHQSLLSADGTPNDLTGSAVSAIPAWEQSILPNGEMIANRPGGVYAINFDGTARRIDDGSLVAVGTNHYAVHRCDAELRCARFMVDAHTGDAVPANLEPLAPFYYFDPSLAISPDGRFIVYTDWQRPEAVWRLIAVESGDVADLFTASDSVIGNTWAADSSGVFSSRGDTLLFNGVDGKTVGISGFGPIHAIATQAGAVVE